MAEDNVIEVKFTGDTSGMTDAVGRITQTFDAFHKNLQTAAADAKFLGDAFQAAAAKITSATNGIGKIPETLSTVSAASRESARVISDTLGPAIDKTEKSVKGLDESLTTGSNRGLMRSIRLATYGLMRELNPALGQVAMTLDRAALSAQLTGGRLAAFAAAATIAGTAFMLLASKINAAMEEQKQFNLAMASGDLTRMTSQISKYRQELEELAESRRKSTEALKGTQQSPGMRSILLPGPRESPDTFRTRRRLDEIDAQIAEANRKIFERQQYQRMAQTFGHEYTGDPIAEEQARQQNAVRRNQEMQSAMENAARTNRQAAGAMGGVFQTQAMIARTGEDDRGAFALELKALQLRADEVRKNLALDLQFITMSDKERAARQSVAAVTLLQVSTQKQLIQVQAEAALRQQVKAYEMSAAGDRNQEGDTGAQEHISALERWVQVDKAFDQAPSEATAQALIDAMKDPKMMKFIDSGTFLRTYAKIARTLSLLAPATFNANVARYMAVDDEGNPYLPGGGSNQPGRQSTMVGRVNQMMADYTSRGRIVSRESLEGIVSGQMNEEDATEAFDRMMKPLSQRGTALSRMEQATFGGRNQQMAELGFASRTGATVSSQLSSGMELGLMKTVDQLGTWGENMERVISGIAGGMTRAFDDLFFNSLTGQFNKIGDTVRNLGFSIVRELTGAFSRVAVSAAINPLIRSLGGGSSAFGAAPIGMLLGGGGGGGGAAGGTAGLSIGGYALGGGAGGVAGGAGGIGMYDILSGISNIGGMAYSTLTGAGGIAAIGGGMGLSSAGMIGNLMPLEEGAAPLGAGLGTAGAAFSTFAGAVGLGMSIYGAATAKTPLSGAMAGIAAGVSTYALIAGASSLWAGSMTAGAAAAPYTFGISLVVAAAVAALGTMVGMGSQNRGKRLTQNAETQKQSGNELLSVLPTLDEVEVDAMISLMETGTLPADSGRLLAYLRVDWRPARMLGDVARQQPQLFQQVLDAFKQRRAQLTSELESASYDIRVTGAAGAGMTRTTEMSLMLSDPEARLRAARERSAFGEVLLGMDDQVTERLLQKLLNTAGMMDLTLVPKARWQLMEGT